MMRLVVVAVISPLEEEVLVSIDDVPFTWGVAMCGGRGLLLLFVLPMVILVASYTSSLRLCAPLLVGEVS